MTELTSRLLGREQERSLDGLEKRADTQKQRFARETHRKRYFSLGYGLDTPFKGIYLRDIRCWDSHSDNDDDTATMNTRQHNKNCGHCDECIDALKEHNAPLEDIAHTAANNDSMQYQNTQLKRKYHPRHGSSYAAQGHYGNMACTCCQNRP